MDRRTGYEPQVVGDATLLAGSIAHLFDRPLSVGTRPDGSRVWIAPGFDVVDESSFRSFDHPVLGHGAATFAFFPAITLSSLMIRLEYGPEDISIPMELAVTIVADLAQQLTHSGLPHPLVHPAASLVGFDGTTRTLLLEAPPVFRDTPSRGIIDWSWDDDDYPEDGIGIMPIPAIFAEDRRAQAPDPASDDRYLSPEEADGEPPNPASAVWRLASILLHLLDRGVLESDSRLARIAALREGSVSLRREAPPRLRALVERALSVDPSRRAANTSAFHYHLQPFVTEHARVGEWLREQWRWTFTDQLKFVSETEPTLVRRRPPPPPSPWIAAGDLEVMVRPVTQSELDAALGLLTPRIRAGGPAVLVDHAQAETYAATVGGRLPTSEEWTQIMPTVIDAGGEYGHIWEWTSTPHRDGFTVRGGPWRNLGGIGKARPTRGLAVIDHESWESRPASDLGLRLVRDRG